METTTLKDQLVRMLQQVRNGRGQVENVATRIAQAQALLEQTLEWKQVQELKQVHKAFQDVLASQVEETKTLAIAIYNQTGEKVFPGVTVKTFRKFFYETAKALEWAKVHQDWLLVQSLDTKAFEKSLGQMTTVPDFVTVTVVPQAGIASDLSDIPAEDINLFTQPTQPEQEKPQ